MVPTKRVEKAVFVCAVELPIPAGTQVYRNWTVNKGWDVHFSAAGEIGPGKRFGIGDKTYDVLDNDLGEMEPENPKPGDICKLWFYGNVAQRLGIPTTRGGWDE